MEEFEAFMRDVRRFGITQLREGGSLESFENDWKARYNAARGEEQ